MAGGLIAQTTLRLRKPRGPSQIGSST